MPQPEDSEYAKMELYDWTTGDVSSANTVNGILADSSLKIAAPMPWFTSLWTLQEACFRPDLVLCDKHWQLLAISNTPVTLDCLVALSNFVTQNEFARSVTRTDPDKQDRTSSLPSKNFPGIAQPLGCRDLTALLLDTHISSIITVSAAAVFSFGQFRQCTSKRGEAIMSVVGSKDWHLDYVKQHNTAPPENDLIMELYPLAFVQEAAYNIGPTFFSSFPTELRYLQGVVDLANGNWQFLENPAAVGSMLPFSRSPGYFAPPMAPTLEEEVHPSTKEWQVALDGSVTVKNAGILSITADNMVEAIVQVPLYDENDHVHFHTEVRTVEEVNLGGWLEDFGDADNAPNFAVSLFQVPHLGTELKEATHTGILLKSCGKDVNGHTNKLVKVGLFFTSAILVEDVPCSQVDWQVL